LNTSDGLLDNEVFKIAAFKDLAYYSTIYGIGTFSISNRRKNEIAPKIDLSEVVINKAQKFVPNGNYEYHSNINLKFDLISFKETAPLKIFYQLKGYENIWKWSENGDINYTNLPNGDYIFKAYAVNSSGYKSAMYQIPFSIKIPYYKTWWFILSILGAILLLSYSVYRITYYYIDKREVNRTRINKMLAEYQLMGLKAQMNPHFIFNCLNSIQKYVLEHDTKQAYTYMAKFSKLIRFVLDISDKTFVALSDELELVKIYVELEQLRFDNKFEFILTLDGNIDPDEIILPSLLIQPYLENAIWHGIMNLPTNISGEVRINVSAVNHHIEIVITDNGIGRKKAKLLNQKSHQSKGLSINQKRIEAINYLLKTHNATIELIDMFEDNGEPKGTKVIIKLPLKYDE
jgi:sensor histidine kinase YesM